MGSPRHIRIISRVTTVVLLLIVVTMVTWFITGMPSTVESAITDAMWKPCPGHYAIAKTATDTADADSYVLKPRSRFEKAITCGTMRANRLASTK